MILETSTAKLEAFLSANVAALQPQVHVDYVDYGADGQPALPAPKRTYLNNSTAVTILAAPSGAVKVRELTEITFYNADSAAVTTNMRINDGTTTYGLIKQSLLAGETLVYEKKGGWQVI